MIRHVYKGNKDETMFTSVLPNEIHFPNNIWLIAQPVSVEYESGVRQLVLNFIADGAWSED